MKTIALGIVALLSACATLLPQQDYVARNGLFIYDRPGGAFEVVARPGTAGPDYFCAAGDFARIMRNARATDRVIMVRPDGPSGAIPGARSAVFTIGPPGPRKQPLISTVPMRQAGASLPVASAQALCRNGRNTINTIF